MLLVRPTLDAAWPAIAALGAVGAIVAGPRLARWAAVRLQLLFVHISLLRLSEGGSVFSSWRGVAAWPLVQYELFKLLSLEASHRLDSFGHVDTGVKRGGGRRCSRAHSLRTAAINCGLHTAWSSLTTSRGWHLTITSHHLPRSPRSPLTLTRLRSE